MTIATSTKPDWAAIRAASDRILANNDPVLQAFREKAAIMFRAILEGAEEPFKRRPPVSLRLICQGEPPAKLVVPPGWNSVAKTVNLDWAPCELFQETRDVVRDICVRRFGKQVSFSIGAERPSRVGAIYRTAEADVGRAIEVMRDFLGDHGAVFARSHDHCSCCGRALIDELSRSRGIGPECIKKIPYFAFKERPENQLVVPEAEPVLGSPTPALQSDDTNDAEPFRLIS
jgi:hypothetical protein